MARLDWYIRANLKPRHLQLLVGLDDLRHVGRVAELLNISQPAVSKALAEIERGLGLQLFERGRRGLVPTVYGECLIRLCRAMLHSLDTAGDELRRLQTGAGGRVRIGVLPVAAPVLVPRAVMLLHLSAPKAVVVLHEATADRLLPMLRDDELDLMVGALPPASQSVGLEIEVLHPGESVAVVCGRQHPLARRRRVTADDLARYPMVIPPRGTLFRDNVERLIDALGLSMLPAHVESGSMTASNALLRESDAVSFYSEHLAQHYARAGWLHHLPVDATSPPSPIGVARPKHREPSATTLALIDALRVVAARELGVGAGATREEPAP